MSSRPSARQRLAAEWPQVARIGPTLNVQVAASALLVFTSITPGSYALARPWETLIGAVVTIALSVVLFPPDAAAGFSRRYGEVSARLTDMRTRLSGIVVDAPAQPARLSELLEDAGTVEAQARTLPDGLSGGQRAIRYNPSRSHQLPGLSEGSGHGGPGPPR